MCNLVLSQLEGNTNLDNQMQRRTVSLYSQEKEGSLLKLLPDHNLVCHILGTLFLKWKWKMHHGEFVHIFFEGRITDQTSIISKLFLEIRDSGGSKTQGNTYSLLYNYSKYKSPFVISIQTPNLHPSLSLGLTSSEERRSREHTIVEKGRR